MVNYLLYRQLIIKHSKKPFNYGLLPITCNNNCLIKKKHNLLCGDEITLQIFFNDGFINSIRHETKGCSIICASSSIMSISLSNQTFTQSLKVINNFINMLQNKSFDIAVLESDLLLFEVIANIPNKLNCTIIPWLLAFDLIQNYLNNVIN
ncbi:MAG: iron-sulfur cluster assembly scaffold protein [Pigeon pea little leaf phytoplasma]|uniref:Iron-sulfur cluster assembly scaffold protein n=1 Tax=Candidatus Phytoplasma fabacearum TaxID=2982628 RepID=A0ABU8ZSY8_9MOLU|nr:iron-sulfur cluster assembly scaffold protein ['Bituminaria bituminosa' little leaf phytoplasma]MDV3148934.1 iron-sulfur cluster assembly scaffold protein [Pigeon pea little leaf phytoplasma]MDO7983461.1 iron-sulfur cluster assembly scaffold protein ['Bituminaria bituminosa' little leaf phytoplasma]MDO8023778.1 iron-sulfur cluster assembly scaffold protein ['Bituminaria bituminosa' little leaf phytoplasma]MDO8030403.1 iron-sulfur cluster assembly scaffold protein ['Bituminaria bituminosa' li